eukprot:8156865-Alexandrium_andersonii.AAC.1
MVTEALAGRAVTEESLLATMGVSVMKPTLSTVKQERTCDAGEAPLVLVSQAPGQDSTVPLPP